MADLAIEGVTEVLHFWVSKVNNVPSLEDRGITLDKSATPTPNPILRNSNNFENAPVVYSYGCVDEGQGARFFN